VGYGQVVATKPQPPYLAVFGSAYPIDARPDLKTVVDDSIRLLAIAGDELLANGRWPIVGNLAPNLQRVPFPCFKTSIGSADEYFIINFDGSKRRPALAQEVNLLPNRSTFSGIELQLAFQALHGVGTWEADWHRLTHEYMKGLADACQL
jgi:hypothetical protein